MEIFIEHGASSKSISFGNLLYFKVKIENRSSNEIKNLNIENFTTVDFEKKYYEFEKSNDNIQVNVYDGTIQIDMLKPKEYINIYISMYITNEFTDVLVSFAKVYYETLFGEFKSIKSNESSISFLGADFRDDGFKLKVSKEAIDIDDTYIVGIELFNKGTKNANDVKIFEFTPKGCIFMPKSFSINGNYIDLMDGVDFINISDIKPLQRIKVNFKIKVISKEIKEINQAAKLAYKTKKNDEDFLERIVTSNIEKINIRNINLSSFVKILDKEQYKINEYINFELKIKNEGNINLVNLKLIESKIDELEIDYTSFKINGIASNIKSLDELYIDTLSINESCLIEYRAKAKKQNLNIETYSILEYKYLSSAAQKFIDGKIKSNITYFSIVESKITIKKFFKADNIFLGDEIIFELEIFNYGNIDATNIIITDEVFDGFELNSSSIINYDRNIDGSINVKIPFIKAMESKKITYRARAIRITNTENEYRSYGTYLYKLNKESIENKFITITKGVILEGALINSESIIRLQDLTHVSLFDEINFTTFIKNIGNLKAKAISIKESIPQGLLFIEESLFINGKHSFLNIGKNIILNELYSNEELKLEYKLKVIELKDKFNTKLQVSYISKARNEVKEFFIEKKSDDIFTACAYIDSRNGIFKSNFSKKIASLGEIVDVYTQIKNIGNKDAFNVLIENKLDSELEFCSDIIIKGDSFSNKHKYINIEKIKANETIDIRYRVLVKQITSKNVKANTKISYNYYIDNIGNMGFHESESESAILKLYDCNITIKQNISEKIISEENKVLYNIFISNDGNIDIDDTTFKIDVNDDIDLEVLDYKINDSEILNDDIKKEINILKFAKSQILFISIMFRLKNNKNNKNINLKPILSGVYKYDNNTKRIIEKNAEVVTLNIEKNLITISKKTNKDVYLIGELVEYKIIIKNNGTSIAKNLIIKDVDFNNIASGKLLINGKCEYVENNCINIISLKNNEEIFISYSCKYETNKSMTINNNTYVYSEFDNQTSKKKFEFKSNFQGVNIEYAKLELINSCDNKSIRYKDEVEIVTSIFNKGNLNLNNIYIELKYSKAFFIKEIQSDFELKNGFLYIPFMNPQELILIKTIYIYNSYSTFNDLNYVAYASFNLIIDNEIRCLKAESKKLIINSKNDFSRSLDIESNINFEDRDLKEIININAEASLEDSYIINTIKSKIYKDKILTGKKLIARGQIKIRIEYIENNINEEIRALYYDEDFVGTIIMPEDFAIDSSFDINLDIDDIFYKLINKNNILINTSLEMNLDM